MLLNFLATAGHMGLMGGGARLLLAGVEHVTGIPVYTGLRNAAAHAVGDIRSLTTPVLEAIGGPELAALSDPSKQFRTVVAGTMTVQEYAAREAKRRRAAQHELAAYKEQAAAEQTQRALDEAAAQTSAAEQRARDLEAQLAAARTEAEKAALKAKARGARRWALTSRNFLARANATAAKPQTEGTLEKVMELALKAMSTAQAAAAPPADARHILADDRYTPEEKSAAQYSIDAVNRDDAFDVDAVVRRLSSDDQTERESAEDELLAAAELSGPDHHHHHGGASCGCGGECGPCKARKPALAGDDHWDWDATPPAVPTAGADAADALDWESDQEDEAAPLAGPDASAWDYDTTAAPKPDQLDPAFAAKLDRVASAEDEDCGCVGF